jgi:hypothetical protein
MNLDQELSYEFFSINDLISQNSYNWAREESFVLPDSCPPQNV